MANLATKKPRSDKNRNRAVWIVWPCDGCGKPVWRRRSAMRPTMYCEKACYWANGAKEAGRKGGQQSRSGDKDRIAFLEGQLDLYVRRYGFLDPNSVNGQSVPSLD